LDRKNMQEIWEKHRGKVLGILLGLIFGWFTITYGVIKAIFVAVCTSIGYYIGTRMDNGGNLWEDISRIFRNRG